MKDKNTALVYRPPFTLVDQAVLLSENLDSYDKAVYAILCSYVNNEDGSCFPAYNLLAKKAGCSRSKVIRVIANLESKGLIQKRIRYNSNGDNTSNLYVIMPMSRPNCTPPDARDAPPGRSRILPDACGTPELYSLNYIEINKINLSIEGLEGLRAKINYEYFAEEMPDKLGFIDSLLGYIFELEQESKPETTRLLSTIDELVVLEFLEEIRGRSFRNVRNFGAYIKKMFVEFLRKREIELAAI